MQELCKETKQKYEGNAKNSPYLTSFISMDFKPVIRVFEFLMTTLTAAFALRVRTSVVLGHRNGSKLGRFKLFISIISTIFQWKPFQ